MRFTTALDDVLASRGHVRILRALNALPEGFGASVRDLARRADMRHPRTSEVLGGLTELGLTTRQRAGRADLYELNRDHALYSTIHALFADEARLRGRLVKFLGARLEHVGGVREAYLFGSVARDQSVASSDIDVAVVVPKEAKAGLDDALERVSGEARRRFGTEVNFHSSTTSLNARSQRRTGRDVWGRIAKEGIPLVMRRG